MDEKALLLDATEKRESGDFAGSLELLTDALVAFQSKNDAEGIIEALVSQSLTLRHIGEADNNANVLIYAKHTAMAAVEIATKNKLNPSIPLYNMAKDQESLGETGDAINSIRKALGTHGDLSFMAEMKTRLASLECKRGDDAAMGRFDDALQELKDNPNSDDYTQKVWVSGAYLHMAESLAGRDNAKAKELLVEAGKIINADDRLKLRKRQLEKVQEQVN